ncbi:TPA: bacteriocin, partial [Streptococcus equi subsp. zooepidemicus]|nr:bacteriocin [Streptococcus equi subsp. zooepidemicus]
MLKENKKIKNIENYKKLSNQNLQSITGGAKRSESIIVSI